jgi:maltose alpha-D-glucosyltransferase/alpha-amylase
VDRPVSRLLDHPASMPDADDPLWYKDAIIYEVHVKSFFDANGDGIGDFRGITEKLDYLEDLGVTALWLLPFYPSPMKDDGYDVADYHNVHPAYGTRHDLRVFIREAHRRGLKVITELVVNHTSDQHPWFQAARRAPKGSVKRDYYVWSDDPKKYAGTRIIFTDTETSNWTWDPVAQAYYWHRFFSHQPDLNFANPRVLRGVLRTMSFWCAMGVDGFRLDAIPYLCEREGTNNENLPETHAVIRQLRAAIDARFPNRMLLAEANQWPEDVREYFGEGDECHMAYHFPLMPRLFLAIAQEDRHPVMDILRQTPDIPANCQWAIFLRNHDELTLEMVTDRERDALYSAFAADPRMRINVGIRRRLAPLLDNDRDKIELMSFLLFTLPGSPILYYGDEIGMGDNIYLGDRNGVRTPMQWSPDRNAGFSRADPQKLYLPVVMDPVYGYEAVNVEAQARNPTSLLSWNRRMIAARKRFKAFGRGTLTVLQPGNRKVLAYLREYDGETLLCAANLSRFAQAVELDLARFEGRVPVEVMGGVSFPPVTRAPYQLTLPGHGYFLFQLAADAPAPTWHTDRPSPSDLPVLVMLEGWRTFFTPSGGAQDVRRAMASRTHEQLERQVLLPYLESRRWYMGRGRAASRVDIVEEVVWRYAGGDWLLAFLGVELSSGDRQTYFLPLAVAWEDGGRDPYEAVVGFALARVRQKARTGILYGAYGDPAFCRAIARAMGEAGEVPLAGGRLRFSATGAYAELAPAINEAIRHPALEQGYTAVSYGDRLYLKGLRYLETGLSHELEMARFLTSAAPRPQVPRLAGAVEYVGSAGAISALALLFEQVEHEGTLWDRAVTGLERYLGPGGVSEGGSTPTVEALHALFLEQASAFGGVVGALHATLALPSADPAFAPVPVTAEDLRRWRAVVLEEITATLDLLEQRSAALGEPVRVAAARALAARARLVQRAERWSPSPEGLVSTRYHGHLHLGQVLAAHRTLWITDFEGEPWLPTAERRRKHSPLRDVAPVLQSGALAARTVLARLDPARAAVPPERGAVVHRWLESVSDAFLRGYREATLSVSSVPHDAAILRATIGLFAIELGLRDLHDALDNRAEAVPVAIAVLLDLMETMT